MAVAFDAFSSSTNGTTDRTSSHVPSGTPRAVLVLIVQALGTGDEVSGVTYGALALTELSGSPHVRSTGDTGTVYAYFAGASIPTGTQTVTATVTDVANKRMGVFTLTAADDTEVVDVDATINASVANPSVTLSLSSRTSWCALGFYSGQGAVGDYAPLANWSATNGFEQDQGSNGSGIYSYNIVGTTDVTAGWTQVADDALMIAVAISEVVGAGSGQPTSKRGGGVAHMGSNKLPAAVRGGAWSCDRSGLYVPRGRGQGRAA